MSRQEFINKLEYQLAVQKQKATGRRMVARLSSEEEARKVNAIILEREVERWRTFAKQARRATRCTS